MDVKAVWTLPTTRASGRPLDVSDIAGVEVSLSADQGVNFTVLNVVPPPVLELVTKELEPGTWVFRAVVVDKAGKRSSGVAKSIVLADSTNPSDVVLDLSVV